MLAVSIVYWIGLPLYHSMLGRVKKSGTCGPDVEEALNDYRNLMETIYNDVWSVEEQQRYCRRMYDYGRGGGAGQDSERGWDISQLHHPDLSDSPKGTGDCEESVTIRGNCYSVHEVNYFFWGAANKICGESLFVAKRFAWTWSTYQAPINALLDPDDIYEGTAASKTNWTTVGYWDDYGHLTPELSQFHKCDCSKSKRWQGKFTYNWGDDYTGRRYDRRRSRRGR